jgi:hypothetical protein
MSLIVDINPVPWEILDLVRARILRNRAKKQRRQLEKLGELRRVMQVDRGLLAKQRWEEPSFFGEGGIHYSISIIDEDDNYGDEYGTRDINWLDWSNKTDFTFINKINDQETQIELSNATEKRFILLVPKRFQGRDPILYPSKWPNLANDANGGPVGVQLDVTRYDFGSPIARPSDYFTLIEQATGLSWADIKSVVILVDSSGSMFRTGVALDLDAFQAKITELNIPFAEYLAFNENWIYPHNQ